MAMWENTIRTDIARKWSKGKVLCGQLAALLKRASIQYAEDFAGNAVWNIWNELEGITERANDETIIAMEKQFSFQNR